MSEKKESERPYAVVDLEMETVSPLVTGEIKKVPNKGTKPVRKTAGGSVAVPIYGAIRAGLEKSLRDKGEKVCDSGKKTCGRCVLCGLFGSLGKGGRALIDDMVSERPASEIAHPSTHVRLNRDDGTVDDSLSQEEVEEGAKFTGRMIVDSANDRDIELIHSGIESINEFGLGGWKTRGRGRVNMRITGITWKRHRDFMDRGKEKARELLR